MALPDPTTALVAALVAVAGPALALALPLATWAAGLRGRSVGIDLGSHRVIRVAALIDTVVLDRWGTVTTGHLRVSTVEPLDPVYDRDLRWFAGALGHAADDPVGRAIARLSGRGRLTSVDHREGLGIEGAVDRHPVRVGRPEWVGMAERNDLGTTVGVELDHRPIGYITVADDIRPDAATAIDELARAGIKAVLVSDDNALNTESLARSCGIEDWYADSKPEKRDLVVSKLRERGRRVAAAGHPPGNGAMLGEAEVALSTDVAQPSTIVLADVAVSRVATALSLSRAAARATSRSRRIGLGTGLLGIVLAATGLLSPLLAVAFAVVAGGAVAVAAAAGRPAT